MQLINCKMSYIIGDNIVKTTELKNNDYTLNIQTKNNILSANIETNKEFCDFKIEFYLKIDNKYKEFITNGMHTWLPSFKLNKNKNENKVIKLLQKYLYKGTGLDNVSNNQNNLYSSYGFCYFKQSNSDEILLFASLTEEDTFTSFSYDFERCILKVVRDFKGFSINKNFALIKLVEIENVFDTVLSLLKTSLKIDNDKLNKNKIIAYNTFSEFKCNISEKIIKNKIHNLQNNYNMFIIGDGYSSNGYDLFNLDNKRFPRGFKPITDNFHEKEIKAGLWVAPFAISPLSKSYTKYQDLVIKQNNKPVITCPFWDGCYSLDITNSDSIQYLKDLFNLIINEWGFDTIYCDCMYMAGCLPTNGKTTAMLIDDGIKLIRKLTTGCTLILGGVPFLSGINNCDYISIALDANNCWYNVSDILSPELPTSAKSSLNSLVYKKILNEIYPSIYTIPNNKKIKHKLINLIANSTDNLIIPDNLIKETTYPTKINLN